MEIRRNVKTTNRLKMFSLFLLAAYVLAACGGTLPASATSAQGPKVAANVVALTGVVEAMNGSEWTIGGQKLILDPQISLDPDIAVGDQVRVEGKARADGAVIALKVESSKTDDLVSTASADGSSTPDANRTPDASASQSAGANGNEVFGTVEALSADVITVNGVTYNLANFTEMKGALQVGDQVKVHVTLNADGALTVREIEKSAASVGDNGNASSSNDGPNQDLNDDHSNGSSSDDGSNHDTNDDHGGNGGNSGSGDD
jgi:hypothetical protein